jgi:hypothetical protein
MLRDNTPKTRCHLRVFHSRTLKTHRHAHSSRRAPAQRHRATIATAGITRTPHFDHLSNYSTQKSSIRSQTKIECSNPNTQNCITEKPPRSRRADRQTLPNLCHISPRPSRSFTPNRLKLGQSNTSRDQKLQASTKQFQNPTNPIFKFYVE